MALDFSTSGNARVVGHTIGALFMAGVLDISRFQVAVSNAIEDIKSVIPVSDEREEALDAFLAGIGKGIGYNLPESLGERF